MAKLEELKKISNDTERWEWLIKNQGEGVSLNLDNDDTYITIDGEEGCCQFDEYIGYGDGVETLLKMIGIKIDRA